MQPFIVALLTLAFTLIIPPGTSQASVLTDISDHWAESELNIAVEMGYLNRYPDGTVRPSQTLSKAEFVQMLVAARNLEPIRNGAVRYEDTVTHWSQNQGWLTAAEQAGIIASDASENGRFHPDRAITRQEMAVMVVRAMAKMKSSCKRRFLAHVS